MTAKLFQWGLSKLILTNTEDYRVRLGIYLEVAFEPMTIIELLYKYLHNILAPEADKVECQSRISYTVSCLQLGPLHFKEWSSLPGMHV